MLAFMWYHVWFYRWKMSVHSSWYGWGQNYQNYRYMWSSPNVLVSLQCIYCDILIYQIDCSGFIVNLLGHIVTCVLFCFIRRLPCITWVNKLWNLHIASLNLQETETYGHRLIVLKHFIIFIIIMQQWFAVFCSTLTVSVSMHFMLWFKSIVRWNTKILSPVSWWSFEPNKVAVIPSAAC